MSKDIEKDLQSIQRQLKIAIQNHQFLVVRLQQDPENGSCQKQIHELQKYMMSLSEDQKCLVQKLRKELEGNKSHQFFLNNNVNAQDSFKHAVSPAKSETTLSLAPPIRVPHYPPGPQCRSTLENESSPPHSHFSDDDCQDVIISEDCIKLRKPQDPYLAQKADFMSAIGLMTHCMLKELQNKRMERKRRTTSNPQFAYRNWDAPEKRKKNSYLSQGTPPLLRKRGQSRLDTSPVNSRPSTPRTLMSCENVNGVPNNSTQKHDDFCALCKETGSLLMCDTCSLVYHAACAKVNESNISSGMWSCPKCIQLGRSSSSSSQWHPNKSVMSNYQQHKAAKEEDKKELLKESVMLNSERLQLEEKVKQLELALNSQTTMKMNLEASEKRTQQSIQTLQNFISHYKSADSPSS